MPTIEWVGTPNFRSGRNGRKPVAIVNHITAGAYPGCLEWMQNPAAQVSSHYLVLKNGRVLQLVKDEDTAWHAGGVNKPNWPLYDGSNPNSYTIGIEHEGTTGELTEAQYQATLWLQQQLVQKWAIPVSEDHLIGHYRIDSVNRPNCPGELFPWNRLFNDLKGVVKMEYAVVYYTINDYMVADWAAEKLGNCALYRRRSDQSVNPDALNAKTLVIIGGANNISHANKIYLSGNSKEDTAQAVINWLKGK